MTTVLRKVRESATWSIVFSVLMMIGGLLAMVIPSVAGLTVTVMIGWLLVVAGVLHLGFAWRGDRAATIIGEIVLAVLYAAIGVYLLARPVPGLASLTLLITIYLVVKGLVEGAIAFKLRPLPGSGWLLFDGILTLVIAAMIGAAWPASSTWAVGVLVGVALFSSGLARLMAAVAIRRMLSWTATTRSAGSGAPVKAA
jgi:uncharacterized membrane protein HdeD (DUF308 family)